MPYSLPGSDALCSTKLECLELYKARMMPYALQSSDAFCSTRHQAGMRYALLSSPCSFALLSQYAKIAVVPLPPYTRGSAGRRACEITPPA